MRRLDIGRLHISLVRRDWLPPLTRPSVTVAVKVPKLGTFLTIGWRQYRFNVDWLPW